MENRLSGVRSEGSRQTRKQKRTTDEAGRMADPFEKCREFKEAGHLVEQGVYPYFFPIEENHGPRVVMDGREMIMFGSNNYLGLTTDPRVQEAATGAIQRFGTSCSGSRFLNGTLALHEELECRLADFVKKPAALAFSTGYQTNLGVISALVDSKTVIIADKGTHACVFDGIFLGSGLNSRVKMRRYKHNDVEHLECLCAAMDPDVPKLIVTDGVFSMEGDIGNVPGLVDICDRYNGRLFVDDAHGLGVMGRTGRGTLEHFDVFESVDLVTCTFSKSFASLGGFVAGEKAVIDYVKHRSRPLIFSASMPPANVAAALKSLEIIEAEPHRITALREKSERMRRGLRSLGFDTGESETPIIPILVRDDLKTFLFWKALFEAGIYTNPVVSPAVPPDRSLLRTTIMATHSEEDLDRVLDTFEKVGKQMEII